MPMHEELIDHEARIRALEAKGSDEDALRERLRIAHVELAALRPLAGTGPNAARWQREAVERTKERDEALKKRDEAIARAVSCASCDEMLAEVERVRAELEAEHEADSARLRGEVAEQRAAKDGAYEERNRLVALLVRLALDRGWKAGVGLHEDKPGEEWSPDWRTLVVVETPEGQASWHFHDTHKHLLGSLPDLQAKWDGHTTAEKYERLARLTRRPSPAAVVGVPPEVTVVERRGGDLQHWWTVKAGDRTVGDYTSEDRARIVQRAIAHVFLTLWPTPSPAPAATGETLDDVMARPDVRARVVRIMHDVRAQCARLHAGQAPSEVTLREPLRAFAEQCEVQLRANDHKGGWENEASDWLLGRLKEEVDELEEIMSLRLATPAAIAREAADVGNFAMMIADNAGGLAVRAHQEAQKTSGDEPGKERDDGEVQEEAGGDRGVPRARRDSRSKERLEVDAEVAGGCVREGRGRVHGQVRPSSDAGGLDGGGDGRLDHLRREGRGVSLQAGHLRDDVPAGAVATPPPASAVCGDCLGTGSIEGMTRDAFPCPTCRPMDYGRHFEALYRDTRVETARIDPDVAARIRAQQVAQPQPVVVHSTADETPAAASEVGDPWGRPMTANELRRALHPEPTPAQPTAPTATAERRHGIPICDAEFVGIEGTYRCKRPAGHSGEHGRWLDAPGEATAERGEVVRAKVDSRGRWSVEMFDWHITSCSDEKDARFIEGCIRTSLAAHVYAAVQAAYERAAKELEKEAEYALRNRTGENTTHGAEALRFGARHLRALAATGQPGGGG